jgi:hypothetical protein
MPKEFQVTCINKPHHLSSFEHITHIGNVSGGWRLSRESAIQRIDSGQERFYTLDEATRRKLYLLVVRNDAGKAPYLKTEPDGKWRDNLLAQRECNGDQCNLIS